MYTFGQTDRPLHHNALPDIFHASVRTLYANRLPAQHDVGRLKSCNRRRKRGLGAYYHELGPKISYCCREMNARCDRVWVHLVLDSVEAMI